MQIATCRRIEGRERVGRQVAWGNECAILRCWQSSAIATVGTYYDVEVTGEKQTRPDTVARLVLG